MAEPTKADRDLAYDLERTGDRNTIAYALAEEREKARAPFLALAEEYERRGRINADPLSLDSRIHQMAADRIRRAAEEG